MSLEHVRIKDEVEWSDEGFSGFEEVTVPMYEGLQPKMEVEFDLKAPKREKDCDAPAASLCSKSETVEDNLDNDFDNLSQVHVKDEAGSEMGVSEAAALAGLYNGCLVKEEMVIGPELVQHRDSYFKAASNFKQETPDIVEPFSCKICLKKAKHRSQTNIQHKRTHMGSTFDCQTCQFIKEKYLDFHIKEHTGERPYVCEVCDKRFAKRDDLVEHRHETSLHGPFSCPICNEKFWRRVYLNEHKKIHTNDLLFKCDVCVKQFNEESDFITHKLTHTTPFSCEFCSKQFKHKQLLVSHTNGHAKETVSCDTCSKEFANKEKFLEHIFIRDELTCDVCFKRFRLKYQLARHKRLHTASR